MRFDQAQGRHTLAEVALWELDRLDDLDRGDALDYTPDEARAAVAAWVWLLGAGTSGATFDAAREEVLQDGLVFTAMHRPVAEFLRLWRGFAWEDFGRADDGWAWEVLDRARELARGVGPALAQQVSVARAVARLTAG
ncbi:MAG: hypothetical protein IH627_12410 [Rubrivivax sp.]|nr:hypothetical protein [Rubrivivax sp.]